MFTLKPESVFTFTGICNDGYKSFLPLYRAILSDNRDVFVNTQNWNDAVEGKDASKAKLTFVALLNPKQFNNCTLLAANINDSLIYHWFKHYHKIKFTKHNAITKQLRYETHTNLAELVDINYFIEKQHYSKYLRDVAVDDVMVGEQMDTLAIEHFGDESFLTVSNNDYISQALQQSNGVALPVRAHGLNSYQHYTNIYFNLALNHTPQHLRLLNDLGLSSEVIQTANTFEAIYQCAMRTALRDIDNKKLVSIITPDINSATYLMDILGASEIKQIDGIKLPVKHSPLTQVQRNNNNRYNAKVTALCTGALVFNKDNCKLQKSLPLYSYKENSNHICKLVDMSTDQVAITIHNDIWGIDKEDFNDWILTNKELINLLKKASQHVIDNKTSNVMLNSAVFNEVDTNYRKQANFIQSSFMILDFDDGHLSSKAFEDIFFNKANKVNKCSFVITNTFSTSKAKPNNFRVFMFYKSPVLSIQQHQIIFDDISNALAINGYEPSTSGLDKVCRNGVQSFYLPCTNRRQQEYAFFRKHGLKRTADIAQYGIDVDSIYKTAIRQVNTVKDTSNTRLQVVNQALIDEQRLQIQRMSKGRHDLFFKHAIQMRAMGLTRIDIEQQLTVTASNNSVLLNKVSGVMSSLNAYN